MLDVKSHYTKFPDWLLDSMHLFHPVQWMILCLVVRKNSFSDASRQFSVRYIAVKTGLKKSTVHNHLSRMLMVGTIVRVGTGPRGVLLLDVPDRNSREEAETPLSELPGPVRLKKRGLSSPARPSVQNATADCPPIGVQVQDLTPVQNSTSTWRTLEGKLSESSWQTIKAALIADGPEPTFRADLPEHLSHLLQRIGARLVA